MSLKKASVIIVLVLLIDQISKFYIKTNFSLGEEVPVFDWFRILFVENEGMAWGTKIPGEYGKLFLTLFRLVAIVGIGYWLWDSVRKNGSRILITAIALIFAGAFGNIIDSVFYGIIFNGSYGQVAEFMPAQGGYGTLFHGKVVDMLYFPLWQGNLPEWIPFWGGNYFTFFEPVFNIADTAISAGVILLLLFNKRAFPKEEESSKESK
ncbi:lipoprotein signal peptidase [Salegentibacter salarius]|uniref:Lipoprotein signal peptidase n=1 Tax=Salegentibacter salarius TaxID=435906 RepID=A0A2N0U212_9FLAO|nr:lipoprotein signal peptidase [Salegentibacter salarius]OEY73723.1 lipoprotein signal peptidase [Salegentibacter salarius]PKD21037.1 lipoprotein signal peptidase [Salegentibacter salarius]SLJ94315.1 signal peptidase II [Salegentibacter salarius]